MVQQREITAACSGNHVNALSLHLAAMALEIKELEVVCEVSVDLVVKGNEKITIELLVSEVDFDLSELLALVALDELLKVEVGCFFGSLAFFKEGDELFPALVWARLLLCRRRFNNAVLLFLL